MKAKFHRGISTTSAISAIVVLIIIAAAGWGAYAAFPSSKTVTSTQTVAAGTVTVSGGSISASTVTGSHSSSSQQSSSSTTAPGLFYLQPTTSTASFTIEGLTALASEGIWYYGLPPFSNIFKQYVPNATFTEAAASSVSPSLLIENKIQMAFSESSSFVASYAANAPISLVANIQSQPATWTIYVAGNSSITSMSQLHGKVFGTAAAGSTAQQIEQWVLLTKFGWKVNTDYSFSYLGSIPSILAAVRSGAVSAAAIVMSGVYSQLLSGQFRSLYNFTLSYPYLSLWASNSFIQSNPDAVRATIEAFLAAGYAWNTNSTGVEKLLESQYKLSPLAAEYVAQTTVFSQDGGISISENQQAVNMVLAGGGINQNFSIAPFISTQFVPISY